MSHAQYMREWRKTHPRPSRAGLRAAYGEVYRDLARKAWRT